jgi:hypothetical protein
MAATPESQPTAHESAAERITSDARNQDGAAHESAPAETGPRDLVDPDELTVAAADGDSGPREEQKHNGGM